MATKAPPQQITSWSFSRYQTYTACPARAKYKFIDKLPEPQAPTAARGQEIHKLAEDFTLGKINKLPKELNLFKDQFSELKKTKIKGAEEKWAFTDSWRPTGWFGHDTWLRVMADAWCVDGNYLFIIDHKTGKEKEDHVDQLELSALAGMIMKPGLQVVSTQLWYIDSGNIVEQTFSYGEFSKIQKSWEKRSKPILNDTRFPAKPGNHCRWCAFSKSKGGPCRF